MKRITYRSFNLARKYVHTLKIKTWTEWQFDYCKSGKKPDDIPSNAPLIYKKNWINWGDWLGTYNVGPGQRTFRSYKQARKWARNQNLSSREEWKKLKNSKNFPTDIPKDPQMSYDEKRGKQKGWKSWADFLGTDNIIRPKLSYNDAKKIAIKFGIKSGAEWKKFAKTKNYPKSLAVNVEEHYSKKREWKGWGDFLSINIIANQNKRTTWLPIKEAKIKARKITKELGIKTEKQWHEAYRNGKIPKDIPQYLSQAYDPNLKRNKDRKLS